MSAPPPPVTDVPGSPAPSRGAQVALGVVFAVLLGLLAIRGYGDRFATRPTEPAATDLTDLNTADPAELAQVPGVGPKMAEAIADHRRVHGPFKSIDELRNVRGVGPLTFEKVRSHFRVSLPAEAPPSEVTSTSFYPPAPAPVAAPKLAPAGVKKIQPGDPPIDLNAASVVELQRLPNVGPVTAQAIVAAREAKPFQSLDDFDRRVKGIGAKTVDKLRPFVVVR